MKLDKTIEVLQQHQKHRRGEPNTLDPKLLTEALDRAIELLIGMSNRSKINGTKRKGSESISSQSKRSTKE